MELGKDKQILHSSTSKELNVIDQRTYPKDQRTYVTYVMTFLRPSFDLLHKQQFVLHIFMNEKRIFASQLGFLYVF